MIRAKQKSGILSLLAAALAAPLMPATLPTLLVPALAVLMLAAPAAHAEYYNLGALDIQPVLRDGAQNADWFIEYLRPGQQIQEKIRISNFSANAKDLLIYPADTDKNEGELFFAKNPHENSDDIADWIRLPAKRLHLNGGESRVLSVNFILPENAGVGLHTGAVMVREIMPGGVAPSSQTASSQAISMEKGVRVYMNVTGPAVTKAEHVQANFTESASKLNFSVATRNLGTTDFVTDFGIELKDLFGINADGAHDAVRVKPETTRITTASIAKPSFGIYRVYAASGKNSSLVTTTLFVPAWTLLPGAALWLLAARRRARYVSLKTVAAFKRVERQTVFGRVEWRRSFVYVTMCAVISTVVFSLGGFENSVNAQRAPVRVAGSYELTVKWGNFRDIPVASHYKKEWEGQISFTNANVTLRELRHFEKRDTAEITGGGTALRFNLTTGPDNDGAILNIEPTGDQVPLVTYENFRTGEQNRFAITDVLNSPGIFPDTLFAAYFKAEPGPEHVVAETQILEELEATPEVEATPAPVAVIPELENLFIEDLPATPEVLADFVLSSDYVEEISTDRKTARVETDSILIEALEATPEVLAEIAATPDLNFIFVPSETVHFEPQEFSFREEKVSGSDFGTLIFVQNKGTPWNTYVSTTEFMSLSGKGAIPASSLTVIPGDPVILSERNGARIQTGNPRTFTGATDKSVLVNVDPGRDTEQVFVMNPQLIIRVPPGTLPGRYRGTLTITSL